MVVAASMVTLWPSSTLSGSKFQGNGEGHYSSAVENSRVLQGHDLIGNAVIGLCPLSPVIIPVAEMHKAHRLWRSVACSAIVNATRSRGLCTVLYWTPKWHLSCIFYKWLFLGGAQCNFPAVSVAFLDVVRLEISRQRRGTLFIRSRKQSRASRSRPHRKRSHRTLPAVTSDYSSGGDAQSTPAVAIGCVQRDRQCHSFSGFVHRSVLDAKMAPFLRLLQMAFSRRCAVQFSSRIKVKCMNDHNVAA
ncbi:uncharacterized protein LOC142589919 [Dermacentor variabilis]|uniref:uncharacterized protein LOC142589919 n=1 Tax=Dermacentor variabilis TaxID=34621 RepID=UPI003F5AE44C